MTTRAVIYTRQGKEAEGNGQAVAGQLEACERLATQRGWQIVARESDNDMSASPGKPRPGWQRVMAMIESGQTDVVIVWAVDRMVRRLADLEAVIDACERASVKLATVSGDLDLSTDQGRLVGRILASVARGEVERKSARQIAANQQAARAGKRRTGCPRPFGYEDDHVTIRPAEADAIRWAADALLGGSTVSAVARGWTARGLPSPQNHGRPWQRNSVSTIMRNPALAGLISYRGEIIGDGNWPAILPREQWQAVVNLLNDPARKPPRGVRTLGGGLFRCSCGNTMQGSINATGRPVYRCNPQTRGQAPGPHCQQMIAPVDEHVTAEVLARLMDADLAEVIAPKRPELAPLHREAAALRANLDTLAADMVAGLITRSQLIAATERGQARMAEIAAALAAAASMSALAPFATAESALAVWDSLDGARRRAVIDALAEVVLLPAGRGARSFDPGTVAMRWREPEPDAGARPAAPVRSHSAGRGSKTPRAQAARGVLASGAIHSYFS
jgi:DNA invertase Pin-like site-specific DNA recombinase